MGAQPQSRGSWEVSGRVWRFAHFEYSESARELRAGGTVVDLEAKPLDVLCQLLIHAGEVVSKEELLESVWPGVTVVEGSLTTAVSKLRKALGEDPAVIVTVPRVGYRIGVPVLCRREAMPDAELGFREGDAVPGREQWRFTHRLDVSLSSEVWLAEHTGTTESRVFKFAADGVRLRGLKREVALARLLRDTLGERADFVRVLECNFDSAPYSIETEYSGPNLAEWAERQGGLGSVPLSTRLRIVTDLARAVAAAHGIGVLHKDLKPANILIAPRAGGDLQVKVADFGSGGLVEPERLAELGITASGFSQSLAGEAGGLTGTLMYLPPEVLAGSVATAAADVYALGVILYQMVAGDFRKPLAPGWESDIADPLLREDIAAAAAGDPARRLESAALLAAHIEALDARRNEQAARAQELERARVAEQRLATWRARRPWVVAAMVILAAGLSISLLLYARAQRQTAIATAVNRFLAEDLLGRNDPFQSGKSSESLADTVKRAAAGVDRQFAGAPEVAARLHQTIARAFDNRTNYTEARPEYDRALALYTQAEGPQGRHVAIVGLQRAAMEARTYEKDSLALAKSLLEKHAPQAKDEEAAVWLASARGMVALIANDAKTAAAQFGAAYERSSRLPSFDENARLTFKQRMAFAHIRLGDGATAERLFRELIDAFTRTAGADSPSVLRVRLNLAQAFMIQNKNREAIDEANRIYPEYVARLGEEHELAMQLLTTRAQCEGALGLWEDAIRDDLAIYRLAVKKQGPASFFAVATLSDAALAQCRAGRLREGAANARKAYETSAQAFGPRAGLTGGTAYTLASCSIGLGQLDGAAQLLAGIDAKEVAQLAGFPDWGANVTLAQAEIAERRGDRAAARNLLAQAAPVFTKPDAEAYQQAALKRLQAAVAGR